MRSIFTKLKYLLSGKWWTVVVPVSLIFVLALFSLWRLVK